MQESLYKQYIVFLRDQSVKDIRLAGDIYICPRLEEECAWAW